MKKSRSKPVRINVRLTDLYQRLYSIFGPRNWWPAQSPFEVMVGAVLTQNTAWTNVIKAITNLRTAGLLDPEGLHRVPSADLAQLIRPCGYYNVKTTRLKNLMDLIMRAGGGDPPRLLAWPADRLREELLSVNGLGPETADSIVLYAAGYPKFVIDTYTRRILSRHALASGQESYGQLQALFEDHLPHDAALFNEYHALLVRTGHLHCKPEPRCGDCPLLGF
ncbi:MAG: endonuclease III domain-containing protein [Deltaproteobacteria bacterium]|nr:endonuclease III domain-containing protein [Deltaproteobacteria bacterium]